MTNSLNALLLQIANQLNRHKYRWLGIFVGWRLLILALMVISQATILQQGQWTQYLYFRSVAQLTDGGYYPLINHWIEYPPIFPWLEALLYRAASAITLEPARFVIFYGLLGLVFVAAEIGVLVMVYRLAGRLYDETTAVISAFTFAVTSLPTYIIYGWFDSIAAFFFFWGLHALVSGKWRQSAVAVALGGLTKLFPLFLVAVAFKVLPGPRKKISYVLLVVGLAMLPYALFALHRADIVAASLRWLANKSTYETVWALMEGYTSYGVAPAAMDFIDPATAERVYHAGRVPWTMVTLLFGLAGLFIYLRPLRPPQVKGAVVLAGIIMQMMLLYLKGFSPQFIIWFLPLIPLIIPNAKGLLYSAGISVLNVLEFPVYFTFLEGEIWVISTIIIARTILCAMIAFEYWQIYRPLTGSLTALPVYQATVSRLKRFL